MLLDSFPDKLIFNKIMYAADHNPHRVEQVVDSISDLVRLTGLKLVFVVFVLSTEYLGIRAKNG
jgi:hypothetical protein